MLTAKTHSRGSIASPSLTWEFALRGNAAPVLSWEYLCSAVCLQVNLSVWNPESIPHFHATAQWWYELFGAE